MFIAKEICEVNYANLSLIDVKPGSCFTITFNQTQEIQL